MEERGDGWNIISTSGKGVERLDISLGSRIYMPLILKCIITFNEKIFQDRNRHILQESSSCDVHLYVSKGWHQYFWIEICRGYH